jgi:ribonuclease P protein component
MPKGRISSLTSKRDFEAVFKKGINSASKYLVVYARPNELSTNRLGLSVNKRVGNAVTRNRVKRLLREAMRAGLRGVTLNYDFVLVARKSSVDAELDDFVRDINGVLSRLTHEEDSDIIDKAL